MATAPIGKSMKHKTMALAAADELRRRIMRGVFVPGQQLRQDTLAAEFGMHQELAHLGAMTLVGQRVVIELHGARDPAIAPRDEQHEPAGPHSRPHLVALERLAVGLRVWQYEADIGAAMDAGMDQRAELLKVALDVRRREHCDGGARLGRHAVHTIAYTMKTR